MARQNDHSFTGVLSNLAERVTSLERRSRSVPLPTRIGPFGQQLFDWDVVDAPGFVWGVDAANSPTAGPIVGVVSRTDERIVVEAWATDGTSGTWRRTQTGGVWGAWISTAAAELVFNGGTIAHSALPSSFPVGITIGSADGSFPASFGTVEVVKVLDVRTVQRFTEKGAAHPEQNGSWHRASIDGGTWGPWIMDAGSTDWVNVSSNFLDATASIKRTASVGSLRLSVNTDVPTGTSSVDVTSTPLAAIWRPPFITNGTAYSAGVSATAFLRPDGTVAISNRNSIALTGAILVTIPIMY
jgi:hypothetical protein